MRTWTHATLEAIKPGVVLHLVHHSGAESEVTRTTSGWLTQFGQIDTATLHPALRGIGRVIVHG